MVTKVSKRYTICLRKLQKAEKDAGYFIPISKRLFFVLNVPACAGV